MSFSVGDIVMWRSQANDSPITKRGTIVKIIPPGVSLGEVFKDFDPENYNLEMLGSARFLARTRLKENYLVAVESTLKHSKRRPKLYRPRVEILTRLAPTLEEGGEF